VVTDPAMPNKHRPEERGGEGLGIDLYGDISGTRDAGSESYGPYVRCYVCWGLGYVLYCRYSR